MRSEDKKKYGYMDEKGNYIVKPTLKAGLSFSNGLALVTEDGVHYEYIDTKGKTVWHN
jgi:hypothetical protein